MGVACRRKRWWVAGCLLGRRIALESILLHERRRRAVLADGAAAIDGPHRHPSVLRDQLLHIFHAHAVRRAAVVRPLVIRSGDCIRGGGRDGQVLEPRRAEHLLNAHAVGRRDAQHAVDQLARLL